MSTLSIDVQPPSGVDIRALRSRIAGDVVLPADPGWDAARQAWNLAVDQRPFAVALPESAEDVVSIVEFAGVHGLRIAPQGTGHGAASLESLEDTILVKTERMRDVEIDPAARIARVGAGALWMDVVEPVAAHGLVVLHGSSPDVGVVGYSLGGGMGWLARRYGLSANSVTAVELVTADGRLVRADRENEPDLFWAVRGGGGNFGVVTSIELALYEVGEIYAGAMFWPVERAGEVLRTWRTWVDGVPDEVTSLGRILHLPPIPDIPEPLRGKSFVVVEAVFLGGEREGEELIRPLRELGPAMDTFAAVPPVALPHLHMDPPKPVPGVGDGMFLDDFPAAAIDAVVATGVPPLLSYEVRQLGGALARPSAANGAVGSFDAGFVMYAVGFAMTPEMGQAVEAAVDRAKEALAPWESKRTYFNFSERPVEPGAALPARDLPAAAEGQGRLRPGRAVRVQPPHSGRPVGQRSSRRRIEARRNERRQREEERSRQAVPAVPAPAVQLVRLQHLRLAAHPLHEHPAGAPCLAARKRVQGLGDDSRHGADEPRLLQELPPRGLLIRLAGLGLATGRRPGAAPVRGQPPAHKYLPVAHDEYAHPVKRLRGSRGGCRDAVDLGFDDLAILGIGDPGAEVARRPQAVQRLLPVAGDEMGAGQRLVHRRQVEVLELVGVPAADRLAAMSVVERGLGTLELGVDPRALPLGAGEPRAFADAEPVVGRRMGGVDHLGVLLRCPLVHPEQVPDAVEQLGAETAVKLEIVALALGAHGGRLLL